MPRGDGSFQILERINDNACKVNLPSTIVLVLFFFLSLFGWCRWWFEVESFWEEIGWCDQNYTKGLIRSSRWINYKIKGKDAFNGLI